MLESCESRLEKTFIVEVTFHSFQFLYGKIMLGGSNKKRRRHGVSGGNNVTIVVTLQCTTVFIINKRKKKNIIAQLVSGCMISEQNYKCLKNVAFIFCSLFFAQPVQTTRKTKQLSNPKITTVIDEIKI